MHFLYQSFSTKRLTGSPDSKERFVIQTTVSSANCIIGEGKHHNASKNCLFDKNFFPQASGEILSDFGPLTNVATLQTLITQTSVRSNKEVAN